MKLEMTTNWLPIIQPGLYGTYLGCMYDDVLEDYQTDFKNQLCLEAQIIMNEIFSEDWFVDNFGNVTVSNVKLNSPRYYNYDNDSLEFDLEIENPELLGEFWDRCDHWNFFEFANKNFGSRLGFISPFPYIPHLFENAFLYTEPNKDGKYEYNKAVTMLFMFAFEQYNCALDSYQKDLETEMESYCSVNELYGCEDEEESNEIY